MFPNTEDDNQNSVDLFPNTAGNETVALEGWRELREINMEFRASYVSGDIDKQERSGCDGNMVL